MFYRLVAKKYRDAKGRWVGDVFVERLWRSLEYEEVHLKAYYAVAEARSGIGNYVTNAALS